MSMPGPVLERLSATIVEADDTESLVRPLLVLLEEITGLESTYLTLVDEAASRQTILYSRNSGKLDIGEGLSVSWSDTLCRRALRSATTYVTSVSEQWPDASLAREMGIDTYLSEPVTLPDGSLYGTLCGASGRSQPVSEQAQGVVALFARLIGFQITRERQWRGAESRATQAERQARDLELLMEVNARCFSGHHLGETLRDIASLLARRLQWTGVLPFLIGPAGYEILDETQAVSMQDSLILDELLTPDWLEHGLASHYAIDALEDRHGESRGMGLIVAHGDEDIDGGILLIGPDTLVKDDEEAKLLSNASYALSQMAVRLDQFAKLEQANDILMSHAYMDPLTDVPNRRMLVEHMNRMLAQAARHDEHIHVAFIDLDGFKQINDDFGHDVGDALLMQIAQRLTACVRDEDLVARYGGDEFVCVMPADGPDGIEQQRAKILERLLAASGGEFQLCSRRLSYPGPSIGVVTSQAGELDADLLIQRADQAMYQVKHQRRAMRTE